MDRVAPTASDEASFCRNARRLRAELGANPVRMHRQLGQLSIKPAGGQVVRVWRLGRKGMSAAIDPAGPPAEQIGHPSTEDSSFRHYVERSLAGQYQGVLRYSQRLEFIKEATRRGIGRFEANLIIASVQHRLQMSVAEPARRRGKRLGLAGLMAFVAVQGLIALGYWRLFRS